MRRIDKVNQQIKREISGIIREEIDNPNIGMISITRVDTAKDLRVCRVFFSAFPESKSAEAELALSSMKNFIKRILGTRIRLRFIPDIEFTLDGSIKYSVDISSRLDQLKEELGR